jgi:hypothetical protein
MQKQLTPDQKFVVKERAAPQNNYTEAKQVEENQ